jgi:hypothetical protein
MKSSNQQAAYRGKLYCYLYVSFTERTPAQTATGTKLSSAAVNTAIEIGKGSAEIPENGYVTQRSQHKQLMQVCRNYKSRRQLQAVFVRLRLQHDDAAV